MATSTVIKKWGNSFGVIFPKEFVSKEKLKINQKVMVEVVKEADLRDVFGSLKTKKSGQKFKDEVRKGWN
ncbi:AbrB/MazE/SpoVT family DNA-binding domain-containing protein [Candidatus Micrarchaeota archaeon]|nr:AbrB/MazE/SpoVT family DNA-binding domain-containing protein [Candidatus Micrarchaeota archaeon]MBU2477036.1 AbrB/MazE/SpoVT family DNA-binding domain-containing protein [Candidatus Micrarchaeota archaeon]